MRSLNTLRNVSVAIFYELMIVAFGLIVPKLITTTYGSEVNGLTTTVNYVLQILNLLQAGAAGASIYQMYKPVAEGDYEKISVIMDATRKFFWTIGSVFLALVLAISPVFGLVVKGDVSFMEKSLAMIILGVNGAAYLFFVSYFDVLFSSHQQRFILSVSNIVSKGLYYGLVILIVLLKLPYMLIYVATALGTLSGIFFLYLVYRRRYKPLIKKVSGNTFKIPHRGHLFINQVAIQAITSVPVVMVSLIGDLNAASVISYYFLVYNTMKMILNTMQLSVSDVFGNLKSSKDESETKKVFNLLDFTFNAVGAFLCACTAFLFMSFIYVYTDGNTLTSMSGELVNYMYKGLPILFTALLVFYTVKQPYYILNNVYGHYKETYLQSAIFAAVGIMLSVGLGLIDWILVMTGPILFYVGTYFYRMAVAKKLLSWLSVKKSILRLCFIITVSAAATILSHFFYNGEYPSAWGAWILQAVIVAAIVAAVIAVYVALFERREFAAGVRYFKAVLFRKRRKLNDKN